MAIPKKGSRCIVVDAVRYLWLVERPDQKLMGFAVHQEDAGRTTLLMSVDEEREDYWNTIVTPAIVARGIRQALKNGWRPSEMGSAFKMVLSVVEPATSPSAVGES
jgi:hypothetical protein